MVTETMVSCGRCGAKNKIPADRKQEQAKCGRCHAPLVRPGAAGSVLTLRCARCRTKNRVPQVKLDSAPKCGRCGDELETRDVYTGKVVTVTDAAFGHTILNAPLPVLLYAWAPWCGVCASTGPMVEQLAMETKGKIRVARLNTESNLETASRFNILSLPSFFLFDAGQLKFHLPGAVPKQELLLKMAAFI